MNYVMSNKEIDQYKAKKSHLEFMKYCWQNPTEDFVIGRHTRTICHLLDEAVEDLKKGKSTYLCVEVHPRAGKSEILSNNMPAHFLGEFPDKDVMIVCYNSALAEKNSKKCKNLMRTKKYKELYPDTNTVGGVQQWGVDGHIGLVTASGLISGITGNGYVLGLLDDYCAGREDAESETIREKSWQHFTNDFLTRRAPVSITVVLATQWHIDDIIGRIKNKIDPTNKDYDENFPKFKVVSFPAENGEGDVWTEQIENGKKVKKWEHQKWDFLFPERFTSQFYLEQKASLGSYSYSALYQCNPIVRGGNIIDTTKIKIHDNLSDFPVIKYFRVWDLAHSERQRMKDDPDYTSGTLLAYRKTDNDVWELWVKDVSRIRAKAPERDNFIRAVAEKDGQAVAIVVENSADSKDAVSVMQQIFNGRRVVRGLNIRGDKVSRISPVEPIFEAGNVHILRADWNLDWLNEVREFPSGKHDDQVDNISAGWVCCSNVPQELRKVRVVGV